MKKEKIKNILTKELTALKGEKVKIKFLLPKRRHSVPYPVNFTKLTSI